MSALYILKTGSTLPALQAKQGDFEDWITQGLGHTPLPVCVLDAHACTGAAWQWPARSDMAGLLITGSHDMLTDDTDWMQHCADWVRDLAQQDLPMLGICFGHHLLAQALGGLVTHHPQGLELGSVAIHTQLGAQNDPMWQDMPAHFMAHAVHYQSVRRLPVAAQILAANVHEPHHAFRWGRHAWGVQFHPEFNAHAMQTYVNHVEQSLQRHALESAAGDWQVHPTPVAASLLPRFAQYAHQQWHAALQPCTA